MITILFCSCFVLALALAGVGYQMDKQSKQIDELRAAVSVEAQKTRLVFQRDGDHDRPGWLTVRRQAMEAAEASLRRDHPGSAAIVYRWRTREGKNQGCPA